VALLLNVALQCGLPVDEGCDDVPVLGFAGFHDHRIPFLNSGVDHGLAPDPDGERLSQTSLPGGEGVHLQGVDLAAGFDPVGITGRDVAHDRDLDHVDPIVVRRGMGFRNAEAEGPGLVRLALQVSLFLESAEMADDRVGAFKPEFLLNFPDARPIALLDGPVLNERKNLLLAKCKCFHGERKNT